MSAYLSVSRRRAISVEDRVYDFSEWLRNVLVYVVPNLVKFLFSLKLGSSYALW